MVTDISFHLMYRDLSLFRMNSCRHHHFLQHPFRRAQVLQSSKTFFYLLVLLALAICLPLGAPPAPMLNMPPPPAAAAPGGCPGGLTIPAEGAPNAAAAACGAPGMPPKVGAGAAGAGAPNGDVAVGAAEALPKVKLAEGAAAAPGAAGFLSAPNWNIPAPPPPAAAAAAGWLPKDAPKAGRPAGC